MAFVMDLPLGDDTDAARLAADLTELGNERFLRAVLRDQDGPDLGSALRAL